MSTAPGHKAHSNTAANANAGNANATQPTKQASLDLTEAARETTWSADSFAAELFRGSFRWDLVSPFPIQDREDRKAGDAFLTRLEHALERWFDPDAIDRDGEIPAGALHALAELGCFGIKIPREYGGLGLSQINYNRAIALIASHCASTAVTLSAHQSIGVPQPLLLFGTAAQKQRWLPRLAHGAMSAFALTEPWVGSDPARLATTATPVEGGAAYLLNGLKMWCTNGPAAELLVVMAQTPPKLVRGREKPQITAFVVDTSSPGFSVEHRCRFMGLKGIQNGLLRFENVRVPADHILGAPGEGLKIALTTLNTGRLTLPAAAAAVGKVCLRDSRRWAALRQQWGSPIGEHQAVSDMLARMAVDTYTSEVLATYAGAMADRHDRDIRLEAAIAKYATTEAAWRIVDDAIQIRGGRGYETADSLRARGESPIPLERLLRDTRINRIIEGTSEIMRLFIAREALDTHVSRLLPLTKPGRPVGQRLRDGLSAAAFYLRWYPAQWLPTVLGPKARNLKGRNLLHLRRLPGLARRLSRSLFHAMLRYRQDLDKQQLLLQCHVDIGVDLFTMAAVLAHADTLAPDSDEGRHVQPLADLACRLATRRIHAAFRRMRDNDFAARHDVGQRTLHGEYQWLEDGIMPPTEMHAPRAPHGFGRVAAPSTPAAAPSMERSPTVSLSPDETQPAPPSNATQILRVPTAQPNPTRTAK